MDSGASHDALLDSTKPMQMQPWAPSPAISLHVWQQDSFESLCGDANQGGGRTAVALALGLRHSASARAAPHCDLWNKRCSRAGAASGRASHSLAPPLSPATASTGWATRALLTAPLAFLPLLFLSPAAARTRSGTRARRRWRRGSGAWGGCGGWASREWGGRVGEGSDGGRPGGCVRR